jgi:hypothetical protein
MTLPLRSAALILVVLGASTPMAAQSTAVTGIPLELGSRLVIPLRIGIDTVTSGSAGLVSLVPRRKTSLSSTLVPLQKRELARTGTRIRGRTAGALIGAVVGGAVGFAGGYAIDNAERSQGTRIGDVTVGSAAGGALVGALIGGAVGWLLER